MALEIPGFQWGTLPAASDLSATQFRAVDCDTNGAADVPSLGGRIIGIRQNKPTAGQATSITSSGIVLWETGAAIAKGADITTDASGRAITATGGTRRHGIALDSSSGAGVVIPVLMGEVGAMGAAGQTGSVIGFPINLASITAADIVAAFVPGYACQIQKLTYVANIPATTAAKAATLTPKITGVAVTGGVVSLTTANTTVMGSLVAGTAVTALNTLSATDSITITASAVTAFVEGSGTLFVHLLS